MLGNVGQGIEGVYFIPSGINKTGYGRYNKNRPQNLEENRERFLRGKQNLESSNEVDEDAQRKKKKNNDSRYILVWAVLFTRTNFLVP